MQLTPFRGHQFIQYQNNNLHLIFETSTLKGIVGKQGQTCGNIQLNADSEQNKFHIPLGKISTIKEGETLYHS
jgi:hypothetical protein